MSWQDYITNLVDGKTCEDAAIVGFIGTPCVWASHPGGAIGHITSPQVQTILSDDRTVVLINGVHIGLLKCSVIRDQLNVQDVYVMEVKTKNPDGPTYNVAVGKTNTALFIAKGAEGVHGGAVYTKVCDMCKYLRELNI
ncbi:profilin-2-like [Bombina bombina]|uniref:profilin-2-like n=1 Tax=Bombina bombina TaxID=8345 RepID=UPI00235AE94F|nr:profilin-2-like [Bombina bombina]